MIYKVGSKGEEVRRIQTALTRAGYAVSTDGDYGPKTKAQVEALQRAKGVKPVDGIVGPVTMAVLMAAAAAATQQTNDSVAITKAYINTHISFSIGRQLKYIAIHYTAGATSRRGAALQNRDTFLKRSASADFVVDDEQIVQVNPDVRNYYCWAVGDKKNPYTGGGRLYGKATNRNTVSIEICSCLKAGTSASVPNHSGWYFTDKALGNARRLVRHLMKQYGIPKENVVRHFDVSGKACPGIPGWNDAQLYTTDGKPTAARSDSLKWMEFLAAI